MEHNMVIVGGGIGGLAAALACGRQGCFGLQGEGLRLIEQAPAFTEVGAGIQLGPNVTRILQGWGLEQGLAEVASFPERLEIRSALTTRLLGMLPLGARAQATYGAPYATIARQDLHTLLRKAVEQLGGVDMELNTRIASASPAGQRVQLRSEDGSEQSAACVLAADGVWSKLRSQWLNDGAPRVTGHLAFRAMVPQFALPEALRSEVVTAWLGPDFHAVQYPVRGGEWLNVVVIVHGSIVGDPAAWDHSANAGELRARLAYAGSGLLDLVHAIDDWRLWPLSDRPPLQGPHQMAIGRLALLGDAAHPMRPYLAQGAGMAIEDAQQLALSLQAHTADLPAALAHYAAARWQRNARVQARAIRNGRIFHLQGPMRVARDVSMKLLGEKLLDVPWLYGYGIQ
ncbi:FAD-dependent monooxygenase [Rhodoferax sp.]|uniref:FAD-dependent monooxygenase n=1 Tax=Rhodoferax sp. TaxID=50421 RepID=UPI0025E41AD2|nr:FAD-dependent monooxygenase [Rhodoferax sp.]